MTPPSPGPPGAHAADALPTRFGPYLLVSMLGEGGMAQVFRAVREGPMGFRKEVAIKRIRADLTKDDQALVQALVNEARLGGQLRHPAIVDTYEFGEVDGQHYIAMEFVNGLTLDALIHGSRLRGVRLPPSMVLDLARQVCDGLEYARTLVSPDGEPLALVHRDLKPANIIVSLTGQAKIMDFGIARSATALYRTTATDITKGTLNFMSPEQLQEPAGIDHRSDLFALGAVLFESLTGETLMDSPTLQAVMFQIVTGGYRPRLEQLDDVLPAARPVIGRCVELDREQRYTTAGELRSDVERLQRELGGELGCRELMTLVRGHVGGEGADSSPLHGETSERVARLRADSSWAAFVAGLGGLEDGARDPFVAGIQAPLSSKSLETRVDTDTRQLRPPATGDRTVATVAWQASDLMDGAGAPGEALPGDEATAGQADPGDRTVAAPTRLGIGAGALAALGVGALALAVLVVGIGLWRPWQHGTTPDDDGGGAGEGRHQQRPDPVRGRETAGGDTDDAWMEGDAIADLGTDDAAADDDPMATMPEPQPEPPRPGGPPSLAAPVADRAPPAAEVRARLDDAGGGGPAADTPVVAAPPPEDATEVAEARAPRVPVAINAVPWASWTLSGDAEGAGAQTPYVGELPPGRYLFTLRETGTGEPTTIEVVIDGSEPRVARCWDFAANGPC